MRMDRYEEEEIDGIKQTRTNKNQELYTDVYLNNAYVDITELKEVIEEETIKEEKKQVKPEVVAYSYIEKNYDINKIIEEAINNKEEDNIKRSLEMDSEIDNIIETINENQREQEKEDNLLSDLLPDNNNTTIVQPLEKAITDTSLVDTSVLHKNDMSNELIEELEDDEELYTNKEEKEIDESFKNETKSNKKIIFIIIGIVLVIAIVLGILIWKKIIKLW